MTLELDFCRVILVYVAPYDLSLVPAQTTQHNTHVEKRCNISRVETSNISIFILCHDNMNHDTLHINQDLIFLLKLCCSLICLINM